MDIRELKQHEAGILNLFETELQRRKCTAQHNVTDKDKGEYVRLKQNEYEQIFDREPSFNEKRAFTGIFRHQWKQEQKYTSVFDRRR